MLKYGNNIKGSWWKFGRCRRVFFLSPLEAFSNFSRPSCVNIISDSSFSAIKVSRCFVHLFIQSGFLIAFLSVGAISLMSSSRRRSFLSITNVVESNLDFSPAKRPQSTSLMSQSLSNPFSDILLPVVMRVSNRDQGYFASFNFEHKKQFFAALEKQVGKFTKAYVKSGGDFFFHPHNAKQKEAFLKVTKVGDVEVVCSKNSC